MNGDTVDRPIVLAMTGASGAVYGARLLQVLIERERVVHLTVSDSGSAVIAQELGVTLKPNSQNIVDVVVATCKKLGIPEDPARAQIERAIADGKLVLHHPKDYFTPIASGSFLTKAMVVCPCSGSTLSGIARSASENLIQRAAEVHLKESRRLILVNRETPLSVFQLENMHRLAQAGVVILPASPGWYHGVSDLIDLVDFIIARILDQLDVPHTLMRRWGTNE